MYKIAGVLCKGVWSQSAGNYTNLCVLFDEKVTLSTEVVKTRPSEEVRTGSTPNIRLLPVSVLYTGFEHHDFRALWSALGVD